MRNPIALRVARASLIALAALAALLPTAASAQNQWPIKAFEIIDGDPESILNQGKFAIENPQTIIPGLKSRVESAIAGGEYRLTSALKVEMERYLGEVAVEFERLGFPPPRIDDVVTRRDGSKAYAIYYSLLTNTPFRNSDSYAVYSYRCEWDTGGKSFLLFNALGLTEGGKITDRGYGNLAHELFHAVQRGTSFYKRNCEPPRWITEGLAEAIGHDIALKLRGVKSPDEPTQRWGLRRYAVVLPAEGSSEVVGDYAYQTSSFWRYLAELEHARRLETHPTHKPGPYLNVPHYGTDYRYAARLLRRDDQVETNDEGLTWLHNWLKGDGVPDQGLNNIYSEFVHAYAAYGKHRPLKRTYVEHLNIATGPCENAKPLTLINRSQSIRLTPWSVAATCVRLPIGAIGMPTSIDLRATVKTLDQAKQLWLGVVDEPWLSPATVSMKAADEAIASWSIKVEPSTTVDLVITNVADGDPARTERLVFDLEIGWGGWDVNVTPPATGAAPTPKPASRTPRPQPQPGETTQDGLGSTKVERDEEGPPVTCSWPAKDYGVYCGPKLHIHLKTVATALSGFGSMVTSGGAMSQALATMNEMGGAAGLGAAGMAGLMVGTQLAVDIEIPLPTYGQTGNVQGAVIKVRGGDLPERGAYGLQDRLAGPQTYFPPSGEVEIEAYTPTELRGTFTATLVELPTPLASREDRPTLPSLGAISGRFLVTRPWEGDGRYQMERPAAFAPYLDRSQPMPRPQDIRASPADRPVPAPARTPGASQMGGTVGGCACTCTCEEKQAVFAAIDAAGESGEDGYTCDQMKMAMCTMACGAAYLQCPD